jgi:hypothetical protein
MNAQGNKFSLFRGESLKMGVADYFETLVCLYEVTIQCIENNIFLSLTRRKSQIS